VKDSDEPKPLSLATIALHGGTPARDTDDPVVRPIFQSVNFIQEVGSGDGLRYPRYGNSPNAELVQRRVAALATASMPSPRVGAAARTAGGSWKFRSRSARCTSRRRSPASRSPMRFITS